jgi:hypothetical protein
MGDFIDWLDDLEKPDADSIQGVGYTHISNEDFKFTEFQVGSCVSDDPRSLIVQWQAMVAASDGMVAIKVQRWHGGQRPMRQHGRCLWRRPALWRAASTTWPSC